MFKPPPTQPVSGPKVMLLSRSAPQRIMNLNRTVLSCPASAQAHSAMLPLPSHSSRQACPLMGKVEQACRVVDLASSFCSIGSSFRGQKSGFQCSKMLQPLQTFAQPCRWLSKFEEGWEFWDFLGPILSPKVLAPTPTLTPKVHCTWNPISGASMM